jgi:hypothetical protein
VRDTGRRNGEICRFAGRARRGGGRGGQARACGTCVGSLEARYLEHRGSVVERTDATLAFVERLRAQGHVARLLDARHGDFGGPHDAVVAHAVFPHLERTDLEFGPCSAGPAGEYP